MKKIAKTTKKPVKKNTNKKNISFNEATPSTKVEIIKYSKKSASSGPVKKSPRKKTSTKKAPPKPRNINYRTYHLVKRSDGKWEVKFAGGQKAIKLFNTQKEALDYSHKMADNQKGSVLVHNSKGPNKGRIQKRKPR